MRRTITILIAFLLLVLAPNIHSQEVKTEKQVAPAYVEWDRFSTTNQLTLYNLNSDNYIGTPFLYEEFTKGNIYYTDNRKVSDVPLNYNINSGELIYLDEGKYFKMLTNDVLHFTITEEDGDKIHTFQQEYIPQASRREFIEVLVEGKSALFKRRVKEFKEGEHKNPYSAGGQSDEYVDKTEYLVKENNEIKELKQRKKAVLELFSDQAAQIGIFLKDEEINLRKENDLIKLVEFYNKL